jgi:hypothetical protein
MSTSTKSTPETRKESTTAKEIHAEDPPTGKIHPEEGPGTGRNQTPVREGSAQEVPTSEGLSTTLERLAEEGLAKGPPVRWAIPYSTDEATDAYSTCACSPRASTRSPSKKITGRPVYEGLQKRHRTGQRPRRHHQRKRPTGKRTEEHESPREQRSTGRKKGRGTGGNKEGREEEGREESRRKSSSYRAVAIGGTKTAIGGTKTGEFTGERTERDSKTPTTEALREGLSSQKGDGNIGRLERRRKVHFKTKMRGNYHQRDLLDEVVERAPGPARPAYRAFVIHLLRCAETYGVEEFHHIPSRALRSDLPKGRRLKDLEGETSVLFQHEGSVVDVRADGNYQPPIDGKGGRCREYRINASFAAEFKSLATEGAPNYDLHKGPESSRRNRSSTLSKSRLRDDSGHRWGARQDLQGVEYNLCNDALRILNDTEHRIRLAPPRKARDYCKAEWKRLKDRHDRGKEPRPEDRRKGATSVLKKAGGRFFAAASSLSVIENQVIDAKGEVARIQNAYKPQCLSGRLSFMRGGPQSLPKLVKSLAYSIPNVHNYDIKSSQTIGLRHMVDVLQKIGVDISAKPLDDYLRTSNGFAGKRRVAVMNALPEGLVKRVEHAIKFGAYLPSSMKKAKQVRCETGRLPVIAELVEENYQRPGIQDNVISILHHEFEAMAYMIRDLSGVLLTTYWNEFSKSGGRGKGQIMVNAAGLPFCKYDYEEGHTRRSKAMAWYLQGLEAAYIHALTVLSRGYDYEVFANEHDGCITVGEIPQAAMEEAREISGFREAELAEKPFENPAAVQVFAEKAGIEVPCSLG